MVLYLYPMTPCRLVRWSLITSTFLAPLVFLPGLSNPAHLPKKLFIHIAALILSTGWLFSLLRREAPRIRIPTLCYPLATCLLYAFVLTFYAINPSIGYETILIWGAATVFFVLAVNLIDQEHIITLLAALLASALVVSCIGMAQHLFLFDGIPQYAPPAATFANKNTAVHLLVLTFPLGMALLLGGRQRWAIWATSLTLSLIATYLVYTRTRAGWLAVAVELLVFFLLARAFHHKDRGGLGSWSKEKSVAILAALLLFLILINLGPQGFANGFGEIGARLATLPPSHQNNSVRLATWQNTLLLIKDHPLLGVGSGNFRVWYPLYHVHDSLLDRLETEFAHNDYLHFLAEHGMVGAILLLVIIVMVAFHLLRLLRSTTPSLHFVTIGIVVALLGSAVNAFFCFPYQLAMPPCIAMILLGITYRIKLPETSLHVYRIRKAYLVMGLLLLVILLPPVLFKTLRTIAADHQLRKVVSLDQHRQWEQLLEEGEKAIAYDPDRTTVHSYLGKALLAQGKAREAISHFRKFLRHYPNNRNALINTGLAHLALGEHPAALGYLTHALRITPYDEKLKKFTAMIAARATPSTSSSNHKKSYSFQPNSLRSYEKD